MYCLSRSLAAWPQPKLTIGFNAREQDAWHSNEDLRARLFPPHDDHFVNRTVLDAAVTSPIDMQRERMRVPSLRVPGSESTLLILESRFPILRERRMIRNPR